MKMAGPGQGFFEISIAALATMAAFWRHRCHGSDTELRHLVEKRRPEYRGLNHENGVLG